MTYKVLEVDGKFGVKEIGEDGSSLGVRAERFDTEAEAQGFADSLDRGVSPEEVANQQPTPEAPVENEPVAPSEETPAEPAEAVNPEGVEAGAETPAENNDTNGQA